MVLTDEQNGSLEKSLSDLNLSSEEVDRFEKAFKDPEFRKLFDDYAKEVADPKNKEETDLYLRQLESQQRVEEVYGEGVQLIVPEAGMVVKTEDRASGQKVFINICTSEKINQPEGKRSEDASGKRGMSWKIPLSLGPEKKGHDNKQQPCLVWDFVVHPDTLRMAQSNQAFLDMVVDTAVEKIGSVARGVKLAGSYKRPKMSYKAVPGHPKPSVQALRTGEGGRVDELGRLHPEPCAAAAAAADVASSERSGGSAAQRSAFKFPERSAAAQKLRRKPQGAQDAGFVHPGGEVTPEYRLIHRGRMDLAAAWGDAQRNLSLPELERPAELVLRVTLPQLRSAAEVDLHVAPAAVTLHVPARFKLDVSLPYQVEDAKGRARFDKTSSVLEVCLPVKPPPAPPPSEPAPPPAATPAADECSCSADAGVDDNSVDRAPAEEAAQGGAAAAAGDGPPTESSVSETRARWQEMNEQRDRLDSEQQRPAAAAAAAEAEAACRTGSPAGFTASAEFLGPRPGCAFKLGPHGLGYYPDRPPPAPQQPAPNGGSRERALAALASAGVGGVPTPDARPPAHSASEAPRLAPRVGAALVYELD